MVATAQVWTSPLPPASEIARLVELKPDAAEILFEMAQRQQAHMHECEKLAIDEASRANRRE